MDEIKKAKAQEIATLHAEIVGHLRQSLEKAIRIGELLTEQKKSLGHGEFTNWIKANLPFTDRTARNYMRVYGARNRLKTERVSDLDAAYHFLVHEQRKTHRERIEHRQVEACKQAQEALEGLREEREHVQYSRNKLTGRVIKRKVSGEMMDLPIYYTWCDDPDYLEVKAGEAQLDLRSTLNLAKSELEAATRNIKKLKNKYGNEIYKAYEVDWAIKKRYPYSELVEAYKELSKVAELLIELDPKEIEYPEIKDYPKVDRPPIGWHTWGLEA